MLDKTDCWSNGRDRLSTFVQCARIFLPYLNPRELASVSLTCRTLYQVSKSITSQRISDATRGIENFSVPFFNPDDCSSDPHLYQYFLYTKAQCLQISPHIRQSWGSDRDAWSLNELFSLDPFLFRVEGASGCDCSQCNAGSGCPCLCLNSASETLECGPSCVCGSECGNRLTQGGVPVKVKVVKHLKKGWSLYAAALIPHGHFVCEYAGELLCTNEARQRQLLYDKPASDGSSNPALLVVKEHLPSGNSCIRINIDATRIGNVARFINHSCDGGNLDIVIVRSSGALLPRVCLFASRDIENNEELTFSYGNSSMKQCGRPCFCGTSSCSGTLPSECT